MKRSFGAMLGLMLMVSLLTMVGCSEKSTTGGGGGGSDDVRALQIVMGDSTLEFLPGDSASTNVVVIARDGSGLVVANQKVVVTLQNPLLGLLEFVDAERRDTTNDQGQVLMVFRSYGQVGDNVISAQAGNVQASVPFTIRQAEGVVGSVTVTLNPHGLNLGPGSVDSAQVRVVLSQINGHPIPNVNLDVSVNGGHFSALPATDANGTAVFYWFPDNFIGRATVTASAGGRTAQDTCLVQRITSTGTLDLTVDARRIKADGCVTQAVLRAVLRDEFGTAVVGDTIYFGTPANRGYAGAWQVTDAFGVVLDTLCGGGIPNDLDPADSAIVVARYPRWGLYDSVRVRIDPAANVEQVNLSSSANTIQAGGDSIAVSVQAFYDDGTRISGLYAQFFTECGLFSQDSVRLQNGSLSSPQFWKGCVTVSPPNDRYGVWCTINGVSSNVIEMVVDPGPARRLNITTTTPIVPARSLVDFEVAVYDTFGNYVRDGEAVICSTSAGTLSSNLISTNIDGIARVALSTGTQAGTVTVKAQLGAASADSTVIQVLPGDAASIQLELNPLSVQAAGTGGQSSAQVRALVRDANDNPAPDGTWVTFEILLGLPGGGININNSGTSDSAQTTNGVAVVTLNAGTALGPFTIQAETVVQGITITARTSAGSVVAGPPSSIIIYPSEIADEAGGGAWDLEFSALVLDALNNAVRCSTAVFFEVTPDTAQIISAAVFTCNPDKNNVRRPGTAYTTLRYLSPATNQIVQVTARTAAPNPVQAVLLFQLPIQEPQIDLFCVPNSWNFTERQVNPSQIWCTAYVQDGHSTYINGAEVVFTTQRGRLFPTATGGQEITDGRRFSGPQGSSPQNTAGMCFVWLRGDEEFVFPGPVAEVTCEVVSEVEGYAEARDAVVVNFQR